MSQPPLSRVVRQLEVELGVTLFTRSHRGTELTSQGRLLLEKARAMTEAASRFQQEAQAMTGTVRHTIHLGAAWGLWGAVDRIRKNHARRVPGSRIAVSDLFVKGDGHEPNLPDVILLREAVDRSEYRVERSVHRAARRRSGRYASVRVARDARAGGSGNTATAPVRPETEILACMIRHARCSIPSAFASPSSTASHLRTRLRG